MSTVRTVGQVGVKYQNSKQQLTPELARSSGVLNVHLEPRSAYMLLQTLLTTVDPALTNFGSVEPLYILPVSNGLSPCSRLGRVVLPTAPPFVHRGAATPLGTWILLQPR